jgi:hypothetical protein
VIRVSAGIDDVTDRLRGDFLYCCHNGVSSRRESRIHYNHAVSPNLEGNVTASTGNQVKVGAKLQNLELAGFTR